MIKCISMSGDPAVSQKRATRQDPLLTLAGLIAACALLPTILRLACGTLELVGVKNPMVPVFLRALAGVAVVAHGVGLLGHLAKTFAAVWRRSKALKQLPGPEYGIMGILPLLLKHRDVHRRLIGWADTYGPIYRVRVAMSHVSTGTDRPMQPVSTETSRCFA